MRTHLLHGVVVFDSTGLPWMSGLQPGDYVIPGLVPGSIKLGKSSNGPREARQLLVRAGWSVPVEAG